MKKCLLVIDYQKDFVTGALGFPKAKTLAYGIRNMINDFKRQGHDVIYTFDTHDQTYLQTQEGKKLPIEHCIKGTDGHRLEPHIEALKTDEDVSFEKGAFGSLELGSYLRKTCYDTVECVGLVTNMCVLSNAVIAKAALPEARIIIHQDLCASFDDELHDAAIRTMESMQMEIV
jgi:nicotinamidase/pyrazinamidase